MKAHAMNSVLFVTALTLAGLACNAATQLPAAGSTAGAEPTEAPEATEISVDTGGKSLMTDDFSRTDSGWGTGTDTESSVEYVDGGLHMKIFKDNFITWSNPDNETYQNVHMEVTARNDSGATRAGIGLMCDQQVVDSSYYYFAITPAGEYVIGKSSLGQDDVFLTNSDRWATSDLIAKNAPSYRIGADCGPDALTLYVDGKKVDSAKDTTYTDGGVGLFLWSGDDPVGEVTYDDFVMTQQK